MPGILKDKLLSAGARFNSFAFVRYTTSRHGNAYGVFRCDFCHEERERVVSHVRTGYVKFCWCQNSARSTRHGHASTGAASPTYEAWSAMKKRCLNPRHKSYSDYGARGISVDPRWFEFETFLADMGERPGRGASLDRIDNQAGYTPSNCRWTTMREQNNNRRSNTVLQFDGRTMNISQWAATIGIKDCTLSERLRHGWSVERTLTTATRKYSTHAKKPPALT